MAQFRKISTLAIAPLFLVPCALATLSAFSTSGCEAYHNEQERLDYKKAMDAKAAKMYGPQNMVGPEKNNGWPGYDPPDPTQCPNNECLPDPGSRLVDATTCKETESPYEFMAIPIWDFEDDRKGYDDKNKDRVWDKNAGEGPVEGERFALHGYTYRDDTTTNYYPVGWEPPSIKDPSRLCDRDDNHIFHIAGGPFLEWGGALGRALRCLNTQSFSDNPGQLAIHEARRKMLPADEAQKMITLGTIYCHTGESKGATLAYGAAACDPLQSDPAVGKLCPQRDRLYKKDKTAPVDPPQDKALIGQAIDVSEWEGISFWARRGPNSQPGIRVLVADKYTDDDINFLQYIVDPTAPRYCGRTIECKCKSATRPCTKLTQEEATELNGMTLSRIDLADDPSVANFNEPTSYNLRPALPGDTMCYNRNDKELYDNPIKLLVQTQQYCGDSVLHHQTDSAKSLNVDFDPFLVGSKCQEYTFRGSVVSNFVFNPESEDPAQQAPFEVGQQCGDHWMKSIDLSYDWQLYTVPFNELLQQGWAKRQYKLDLTAITMVRLAWDRGYIDYYIDDVRFYRKKAAKK
jgi:hypothetical protein